MNVAPWAPLDAKPRIYAKLHFIDFGMIQTQGRRLIGVFVIGWLAPYGVAGSKAEVLEISRGMRTNFSPDYNG